MASEASNASTQDREHSDSYALQCPDESRTRQHYLF